MANQKTDKSKAEIQQKKPTPVIQKKADSLFLELEECSQLTLRELQAQQPKLYCQLEASVAQRQNQLPDGAKQYNINDMIDIPLKDHPLAGMELQRGRMQWLGKISGLSDDKIDAISAKEQALAEINDTVLHSMVTAGDLSAYEARAFGLTANLYQILDGNSQLTDFVKKESWDKLGGKKFENLRDLAALNTSDWLAALRKANTKLPGSMTLETYAETLSRKTAALFPTDAFFRRLAPVAKTDLTRGLKDIAPLFEDNTKVFSNPGVEQINMETGVSPEAQNLHGVLKRFLDVDDPETKLNVNILWEDLQFAFFTKTGKNSAIPAMNKRPQNGSVQDTYTQLKKLTNLYPGLNLGKILDDSNLSAAKKAANITGKIGCLNRVREQNPNVEFLKLDYSPGSADLAALKLNGLPEEEKAEVVSTLKAYQRTYTLTKDIEHARTILEAGYSSASGIVNAGFEEFVRATGFEAEVAREYYDASRDVVVAVGAGVGSVLDYSRGGFNWLNVSNMKPRNMETQDGNGFLKQFDDYETLFGNQTYCKCMHCQSILSPAAYFVDLMYFLEKKLPAAKNPLFTRRSDLWTVELTCDNTNTEIPTLDVVNEILQNYLLMRIFLPFLNVVYLLSGATFEALREAGVPENEVLKPLAAIKDIKYSLVDFVKEIQSRLSATLIRTYFKLIIENATHLEYFTLTDLSFRKLKRAKVPPAICQSLQSLKNQEFYLKLVFLEMVESTIGTAAMKTYQTRILDAASALMKCPDITAISEMLVFQGIKELSLGMPSFRRPYDLSMEKLQNHLSLYELSRFGIAQTLESDPAVLSRTMFSLCPEEYNLITSAHSNDLFLEALYCRMFTLEPGSTDKIEAFEVQTLLKSMGLSRSELGELIKTRFVSGGIQIIPQKRDKDSVQYDIEQIQNLTGESLDRMHRFTRLWRRLTERADARDGSRWSMAELDLILFLLGSAKDAQRNINLENVTALLAVQERWGLSVTETCGLMSGSLKDIRLAGQKASTSLLDRLFNLPSFGSDNSFPRDTDVFVHPAFLQPGESGSNDDALHRLHAGLQVNDEELYLLILYLEKALGMDLASKPKPVVGFLLTDDNLALLYRHARLAKLLKVSIPELFQLISFAIPDGWIHHTTSETNTANLTDLGALLVIYDWWQTSRFTLDDLGFISSGMVNKPENYLNAAALAPKILDKIQTDKAFEFADTLFAFQGILTEEQSRKIITANLGPNGMLFQVGSPENATYRLAGNFSSSSMLLIPGDVSEAVALLNKSSNSQAEALLQKMTQTVLLNYHTREVLPPRLGALLNIPVDKLDSLIAMTEEDLFNPAIAQFLQGDPRATPDALNQLVGKVLRLRVLFRDDIFDPATLEFINSQKGNIFAIGKFENITIPQIRNLSVYSALFNNFKDAGMLSGNRPVFAADDVSQVLWGLSKGLPLSAPEQSALAETLANVLQIEMGLAVTLLNGIPMSGLAPNALMKLANCAKIATQLGVGGETLPLIISDSSREVELAGAAVQGAFRGKFTKETDWEARVSPLENKLRSRKRDVLCDFLLQLGRLNVLDQSMETMHDLYQYFLIDAELEGCARTSRVVAAISSVQLYIQRCLMNLESVNLTPEAAQEWEWRKSYRVWEANRKVFLYPENYIEPDLRDDKTPLFKELESKLLQQEITPQNVLDAYSDYLNGFEEVARLKIAGSYHDIGPREDTLHLFGVTPDNPPKYYYRAVHNAHWGEVAEADCGIDWTHWRKVDVQIPVRKVAPIVYLGRLFVFWVEMTTTPKNDLSDGASIFVGYKHKMNLKYTSLRLDGTWTAPQVIYLQDSNAFPTGDGIIEDPLCSPLLLSVIEALIGSLKDQSGIEATRSFIGIMKQSSIPRYGTEPHVGDPRAFEQKPGESDEDYYKRVQHLKCEPKDGYTLTGFQWDQVFPSIWGEDLIMTGSNFMVADAVDFYKKSIMSKNIPLGNFASSLPQILSAYKEYDFKEKVWKNKLGYCSGMNIWPYFSEYASCTAFLKVGRKSGADWGFKGTGTYTVIADLDASDVSTGSPSVKENPLPGNPVTQGTWTLIRYGHRLIYLEGDRVLDWEPATGHYRVLNYDRTIVNGDPLSGIPVTQGIWTSIRTGRELIYLGGDRVLDWESITGNYRIWRYDRTIKNGDPFPGNPVTEGTWTSIRAGHKLIYLGGDRVLDWEPATGHYRIWRYDRTVIKGDPFPGNPVVQGNWTSIRTGHELIYLGGERMLDWEPFTGHYRIWVYDPTITGSDPLPGNPVVEGTWATVQFGHELIYLGNDRVLDWEPMVGHYRIWEYNRTLIGIYNGELDLINGSFLWDSPNVHRSSLQDCIMDFQGDLFLLQGSVAAPPYSHLKRLGTTLSKMLVRTLFKGGFDELLDINTQMNKLYEASFPFKPSGDYMTIDPRTLQSMNPGEFDFKHGSYGVYYREIFFHIPFLIANHLNSQGRFADAQRWYHHIFNPTAGEVTQPPQNRNWRYLEFRNPCPTLREILTDKETIEVYKKDPFNPHAIARLRISAYQKSVVMKYIDNLLDWADSLFAQFTMESVNEATMLYVMAADILGERPVELGECGEGGLKPKNYTRIAPLLSQGEFLQEFTSEMESRVHSKTYMGVNRTKSSSRYIFDEPSVAQAIRSAAQSSVVAASQAETGIFKAYDWKKTTGSLESGMPGGQSSPLIRNPELTADFSASLIRTVCCRSGSITNLNSRLESPVFCIPANTELLGYWDRVEDRLVKIRHCLDINGVRRDLALFAPEIDPHLLVRMKAVGLTLDDVLAATSGNLPPYRFTYLIDKAKQYASTVQSFGSALLGALEKKDVEELNKLRTIHEQNILKMTRQIKQWEIDTEAESIQAMERQKESVTYRKEYYQGLVEGGLSAWETTQSVSRHTATGLEVLAGTIDTIAGIVYLLPQIGSPFSMKYGGQELGNSANAWATVARDAASIARAISDSAGLEATFERRGQEWKHQVELADRELKQIEKQLVAAQIRLQITNKALEIHEKNIAQTQEVYDFYGEKFSNYGLYAWLSTTLQTVYRNAYNSAVTMAQLTEQAYRFERNDNSSAILDFGYWEATHAGLLAGERLLIALQNMERRFIETNFRTFEIDQSFSLNQLNPEALLHLRETGSCTFDIPEMFFNLLYPGQYGRLIKAVRLTIPCVTGPFANVGATLRLVGSKIRTEAKTGDDSLKEVPLQRSVCIATSKAQNDAGVFELNFHDERYMPFEGGGAISTWTLELPKLLRSFDYNTIADVVLHMSYTAKDGGSFKTDVENEIVNNLCQTSLFRVFSLKHEFPGVFNQLLYPSGQSQEVEFQIDSQYFPYFLAGKTLNASAVTIFLKPIDANIPPSTGLSILLNIRDESGQTADGGTISDWGYKPEVWNDKPEYLKMGTMNLNASPLNKWNLKITAGQLAPEQIKDVLLLLTYTAS